MKLSTAWQAVRVALVRLRFIGLVALAALVAASLDDLSALARRLLVGSRPALSTSGRAQYVCPMHPDSVRSEPGKCPSCGMPMHKRELDEGAHVALTAGKIRLGGLAFAKVERLPLEREVTALATLELDERRVARLSTPVRATVLAVHVAATGALVHRGEPIATLSAREIYELGKELQKDLPADDAIILLARQRLFQMGLSHPQIDRIRKGRDPTAFDLLSPLDGILVAKAALVGDQVPELTSLFTVADVSRLWLVTRLPEEDALFAGTGAPFEAELLSAPGHVLRGRLSWLDAAVDLQTRTLAVRAEVENPQGLLRPGMSGRALLRVPVGTRETPPLVVPATAVVDSGLHQIVWREDEEGILAPAEVKVAARVGQLYAVASGLKEGDRIVAQGAFLLSADQRLKKVSAPPAGSGSRPDAGDDD